MTEPEWQTRKQRIDTRLRAHQPSWRIVRYRDGLDLSTLDGVAVEELPTAAGPADYGLFIAGKLLGIIEAKKVAARAFAGQLVPQDPTDEPASTLLNRLNRSRTS